MQIFTKLGDNGPDFHFYSDFELLHFLLCFHFLIYGNLHFMSFQEVPFISVGISQTVLNPVHEGMSFGGT